MKKNTIFRRPGVAGSPEATYGGYPVVHLYCDESGNGGDAGLPLIVGGLVVDTEAPLIEREVRRLHKQLSARRDLRGSKYFDSFREHGFHAKNDVQQIAEPFRRLITELPGFRAVMVYTDRTTLAPLGEVEQIESLYEFLVSDTLLRYIGYEKLVCHIEENSSLKRLIRELSLLAVDEARRKAGQLAVLPEIEVRSVKKIDIMSLGILDYIMMAVKRWADLSFKRDVSRWQFREFAAVENCISLLYSLERGVLVTRKSAVHGQQPDW